MKSELRFDRHQYKLRVVGNRPGHLSFSKEIRQQSPQRLPKRIKELTEVFLNLSRGTRNEDTHQVTVSEFFQDHRQEWQTKFAAKGLDF